MVISAYQKRLDFYEKFLYLMRAKGYQIKGEILGDSSHKYIAFFPPESVELKQWAEIENLKIAASTCSKVNSLTRLEQKIRKKAVVKESRSRLMELERRMKRMAEILKYAKQYQKLRLYNVRYRKSKNTDDYLQKHGSKLILYDGTKQMLRQAGIDLKTLNLDKMRSKFAALEEQKEELQQAYKSSESELKQMKQQLDKLN